MVVNPHLYSNNPNTTHSLAVIYRTFRRLHFIKKQQYNAEHLTVVLIDVEGTWRSVKMHFF